MGFEFLNFNKKNAPKAEKSPEQERMEKQQRNAGIALAGAVAAAGGAAYEIHKMDENLKHMDSHAVTEAEAPAENPTLGMKPTDAPKPVTIELPHENPATAHLPEEKGVVVDLGEKQVVINTPER